MNRAAGEGMFEDSEAGCVDGVKLGARMRDIDPVLQYSEASNGSWLRLPRRPASCS